MNTHEQQLDRIFQALSDQTRRRILLKVRDRDEPVNAIAAEFNISLPAVSKHLKVLEQSGLISRRKDGQKRYCHAEPGLLEDAAAWLEYYQDFWNDRLDGLKEYFEQNS